MLGTLFTFGDFNIRVLDILDILIAGYLIYVVYKYVKGSNAVNIFIGVILFLLLLTIVTQLDMRLLSLLLGSIAGIGLIGIIVIFQPEIRRFLLMVGNNTVKGRFSFFEKYLNILGVHSDVLNQNVSEKLFKVIKNLSHNKVGALILLTKNDLPSIVNTGQLLDSIVNVSLLESIFNKTTPLHDGAVVIKGDRIVAASCILPVSANDNLPSGTGLRHRAGLGISETTSGLVFIVSEESGNISYAVDSKLFYNITEEQLNDKIKSFYSESP